MSDFLFSTQRREPGELQRALKRYLAPVVSRWSEHHGPWGSLAVAEAPFDRAAATVQDGRVLSLLVGDPLVRLPPLLAGFPDDEVRRSALHRLAADALAGAGTDRPPIAWDEHLDGAFALLAVELGSGAGLLVSDLAAFLPVFTSSGPGTHAGDRELVIGTHPDAVARAARRNRDLDLVSAADLVTHLSCTFPHTLYYGVEQFPPATSRCFAAARGWDGLERTHWQPTEANPFASLDDAATALREGLLEDVRSACRNLPTAGLLLSGGEDSRVVLGAVPGSTRVRGFTFADWRNREVQVAERVARAYGAEFVFGERTPDHYLAGFEPVAALVGSSQSFIDVHGWGFHERLGLRDLPLVLGGLSSDSFLKALYAPRDHGPAAGPFRVPGIPGVRPELLREVSERRAAFRARLAEIRPASVREWEVWWPFAMRKHAGNLHGNRRLFRSHEPFHSNAVFRIAAATPINWKRERRLFQRAFRPLLRPSWYVAHSRFRFPYFGHLANLPLGAGLRVARGVRALATGQLRARQGPWPKWWALVASDLMTRKMREHRIWQSPIRGIFAPAATEALEQTVRTRWPALGSLLLLQLGFLSAEADKS